LLGGLALFLYGIEQMTGQKRRRLKGEKISSQNDFKQIEIFSGAFAAIVQSSSVTAAW
jgi:Na+/phosphate symporter